MRLPHGHTESSWEDVLLDGSVVTLCQCACRRASMLSSGVVVKHVLCGWSCVRAVAWNLSRSKADCGRSAMEADAEQHWERVYTRIEPDKVGWYREHLDKSLELIQGSIPQSERASAHVVDAGGGSSSLAADLLQCGFATITVADISAQSLAVAQRRLGERAEHVTWRVGDLLEMTWPEESVRVWHDRAVFHFLTDSAHQEHYLRTMHGALQHGGLTVIGVFSDRAPAKCSGLPVQRYTHESLHALFKRHSFAMVSQHEEEHHTPGGLSQPYIYGVFAPTKDSGA